MKVSSAFKDPSFWLLIGINTALVYQYYQHPEAFTTLIWLYWSQSIVMGFFTFLDILTAPKLTPEEFAAVVAESVKNEENRKLVKQVTKISSAFGFLFFFGVLHLFYLIFIATMKRSGPFDWNMYKYFLCAFVAGQALTFIQHKIQQRKSRPNLGPSTLIPFVRLLPLHLTIILPTFLKVGDMGFFLIVRSVADIVMYVAAKPPTKSREMDATLLSTQQNMNM